MDRPSYNIPHYNILVGAEGSISTIFIIYASELHSTNSYQSKSMRHHYTQSLNSLDSWLRHWLGSLESAQTPRELSKRKKWFFKTRNIWNAGKLAQMIILQRAIICQHFYKVKKCLFPIHNLFFFNGSIHITLYVAASAFHHSALWENSPFLAYWLCLNLVQKWTIWKLYQKI